MIDGKNTHTHVTQSTYTYHAEFILNKAQDMRPERILLLR